MRRKAHVVKEKLTISDKKFVCFHDSTSESSIISAKYPIQNEQFTNIKAVDIKFNP